MALSAVGFFAAHAAVLLGLATTAYVAGSLLLQALRAQDFQDSRAARCALASALGLVLLAALGCCLGLLGHLTRWPLLAVVAAIHAMGFGTWRQAVSARRTAEGGLRSRRLRRGVLGLLLIGPLFVLALYPPSAFDETLYHLPTARAFASSGSLPFLPDLRFPVFPHLAEVLAAEVLLISSDTATHLVQLLAVLLTTVLLWAWGRQWGGMDRPAAGWLAAAAWYGNPLVIYLGGTGYVEPLLALFVTAGCFAFWRWRRDRRREWLVLSAVFVGAAASTKYLGLFFVAALAVAVVADSVRLAPTASRGRARDPLLFAGAALCAMAPWYGRILIFTGNPVFPYLSGLFGRNDWTPVHFRTLALAPGADQWIGGIGHGIGRLVTLPWDVFARRELVGGLPPLSPAYLAGALFIAVAMVRDRPLRRLSGLAVSFVLLFPALPADSRYLVTVLPLFSLALGIALADAQRRWTRAATPLVTAALAVILALPGWLYGGYRIAIQGPLPTDALAREEHLLSRLPVYPAVARVNALIRPGETVYGLNAESMRDFVRGTYFSDFYGPHRCQLLMDALGAPERARALLESWGVDYLLVAKPSVASPAAAEARRLGLDLLYEDRAAALYRVRSEPGGDRR